MDNARHLLQYLENENYNELRGQMSFLPKMLLIINKLFEGF